jgi:cell wall-associated NlpC family hydrolase
MPPVMSAPARLLALCALALALVPASTAAAQDAGCSWYDDYDCSQPADPAPTPTPDPAAPAPWQPPVDPAPTPAPPAGPVLPVLPPLVTTPTVAGKVALLRTNGKAAIPTGAPAVVRAIIAGANHIVGKPYKWGGGHARLEDKGYDCSGSVSYALIRGGLLGFPMVSGTLARWGAAGPGRWVTVYANRDHVYMEVAGLRLDTSSAGDWGGKSGVRWRPPIGKRAGFHVRHPPGL